VHGYDPAAWTAFFTAVTAAAAALTGLLFVAVSINLENIIGATTKDAAKVAAQGTAGGATEGTANGATQGTANGATQGTANGATQGTANGATQGTAGGATGSTADRATQGTTMLPARAAETLATLLFVVIISALALVPQDVELLGAEILLISVPLTVITVRNQLKFRRQNPDSPLLWSASRMTASALALVPGTLAGIFLAAHWGGGLYWLAPAALGGIAGAVYSAWVLLVEIVR
jgi:hypothetical protein